MQPNSLRQKRHFSRRLFGLSKLSCVLAQLRNSVLRYLNLRAIFCGHRLHLYRNALLPRSAGKVVLCSICD